MAEGKGMTKSSPKGSKKTEGPDPWEVRDAMHTLLRAGEIVKDKKMLALVRQEAKSHASKMRDVADQAGQLAMMGRISPKQMAKLGSR